MIAGVLKETHPGERRVAVIPAAVPSLVKLGLELRYERGAGLAAGFPDAQYDEKGATAASRDELFESAAVLLNVRSLAAAKGVPSPDLQRVASERVVVGLMDPLGQPAGPKALAERGATGFALELLPRITRAQGMDVLSSQATVVGYKAVLLAANRLPRLFPMLMTAGGTLAPAKVLVVGVGVAGLQAIATARRLGAVVSAYDVRPVVKEQVESLGARFVELDLQTEGAQDVGGYAKDQGEDFLKRQRELMGDVLADNDVVITTAAVPGKRAPVLVTAEMAARMRPGSVLVDVAAEQGGNCELTRPGEDVEQAGVSILGPLNMASSVANHASQMFAKNLASFLGLIVKQGELKIDVEDEIVAGTLVCRGGEIANDRVREALGASASRGE
jgi:NAD(P) transhydrogenase subunit alpha